MHLADEILQRLERIDVDESAKRQFRQLVEAIAAAHGIRSIERAERVDFARKLHELRTSRATIRDRLIARYGVSPRHSYRIINQAIQLCQKTACYGAEAVSNT